MASDRRLRAVRQGELPPSLAEARRLLLGAHRQVPQRLRQRHARRCATGLERVVRRGGSHDLPDVGLHAQRERQAARPTARPSSRTPRSTRPMCTAARRSTSSIAGPTGPSPFFLSVAFLAPHHEEAAIRARTGQTVRPAPRHEGAWPAQAAAAAVLQRARHLGQARLPPPPLAAADARGDRREPRANYRSRQESLMAVDEAVRDSSPRSGETTCSTTPTSSSPRTTASCRASTGSRGQDAASTTPRPACRCSVRGPRIPRRAGVGRARDNEDLAPTSSGSPTRRPAKLSTAAR